MHHLNFGASALALGRAGLRFGGGLIYPPPIVSAGAQTAWGLRSSTGWLAPPTKIADGVTPLPTGWVYDATYGLKTTQDAPVALDGWDTNGRPILVMHDDVPIINSKVWHNGSYPACLGWGIRVGLGASITGLSVTNCEFDGLGETQTPTLTTFIVAQQGAATGNITINHCWFHGSGGDGISLWCGGGSVITLNRFSIGGWRNVSAHSDCIEIHQDGAPGLTWITDNYFDMTPGLYDAATNTSSGGSGTYPVGTYGRTGAWALFNCPYGVKVLRNVVKGLEARDNGVSEQAPGGSGIPVYGTPATRPGVFYSTPGAVMSAGIEIRNNVLPFGGPSSLGGIVNATNHYGIDVANYTNNYRMSDPAAGGSLANDNVLLVLPTTIPVNTTLPALSGTAAVGNVLSTTYGLWNGGIASVAYRWERDGVAISGATAQSYTVVAGDAGTTLTCTVTATNDKGATSSTSSGLAVAGGGSPPSLDFTLAANSGLLALLAA